MILGIDEAGRGPWAGPLVVGAVVLGGAEIPGLDDSKKLSKKRREALEIEIHEKAAAWAVGWVSARELDEIGMSAALRLATRRAVEQIHVPYHEIIIDGTVNFLADTSKGEYVRTMPKADALIPSVSAASIVAKVARDRYMTELDVKYPEYGFAKHVGYGVAAHRAAIEHYGVTPEHRLSFAPLQKYRKVHNSANVSGEVGGSAKHLQPESQAMRARIETRSEAVLRKHSPKRMAGISRLFRKDEAIELPQTTRAVGNESESAAAAYLEARGHNIIERNWRTKFCEIDIISKLGGTLYFTEVKHRKNDKAGDGFAAITLTKQRQMAFATRVYLADHPEVVQYDIRLAAIATTGTPPEVTDYLDTL